MKKAKKSARSKPQGVTAKVKKVVAAPISRRQQMRECIDTKGDEAARKLGVKLGLNKQTIELYIKRHLAGVSDHGPKKEKPKAETTVTTFQPHYCYSSEKRARKNAASKEKLSGLASGTLIIATDGDKYAIVPRHLADNYEIV